MFDEENNKPDDGNNVNESGKSNVPEQESTNDTNYNRLEGREYQYNHSYYNTFQNNKENSYHYNAGEPNVTNGQPQKEKKKKSFAKTVAKAAILSLVMGSVGGATFSGANYVTSSFLPEKNTTTLNIPVTESLKKASDQEKSGTITTNSTTSGDISTVISNVMPSIVAITSLSTEEVTVPSWFGDMGGDRQQEYESAGSGIIIGKNGSELLIVTNNHVIANAKTITVSFIDDKTYTAQVKGTDSNMDLAVLAVNIKDITPETLNKIKIASLGNSDDIKVGETAIAIGNALGYGQSVTTGVISAVNREVTIDNITSKLIQTDAAINPGNSGGALINTQGEVIGINSMKYSDTSVEGMGYAIPISAASPIIDNLVTKETKTKVDDSEKGYIGISGIDVTSEDAETYSMPLGVYVASIAPNGAAEKAGIVKGDIITKLNDTGINSMNSLQNELQYYKIGTEVNLTVSRLTDGSYQEKTVKVSLGEKPQQ